MKLEAFKTKTELRDMIGLQFPVPDYCMQLTVEVIGWENKTIGEAEMATLNILRKATYNGGIGMKAVSPGSTKLVFIFLEPSTDINTDRFSEACKDSGVISIKIHEEEVYKNDAISIHDSVSSYCMRMEFELKAQYYLVQILGESSQYMIIMCVSIFVCSCMTSPIIFIIFFRQ